MKYGVRIKLDVTKIDKALLYQGKKGVYLDATVFMDPDNKSQYGDHGMVTQDVSKEAKERGDKGPILGNVEVFWTDGGQRQAPEAPKAQYGAAPAAEFEEDENLPF